MNNSLLEQSFVGLLMGLAIGIGIHDMHLDKAAAVAASPKITHALARTAQISSNLHTHTERSPLSDASSMENSTPHRHARFRERKHMKNKYHLKGGRLAPMTRPL